MHGHHQEDAADQGLRPKPARLDEHAASVPARAVADGRSEALTPQSVLDLQRSAGNAAVTGALEEERSPVHDVVSSGAGRSLEPEVRADMEARLGADFGDVRVHDDSAAHESAASVNAHAYTVGSNVVFQRDRYEPGSDAGRLTLAHELTHVMQQRSGPVDGTPAAGGVRVSDPSDRFEREAAANAERVMSAPAGPSAAMDGAGGAAGAAGPAGAVQREAAQEDEEAVQGAFAGAPLQREEGDETEEEPAG